MESVFTALKETPIPTILVIAGIAFLLLSMAGQLIGHITVPPERQRWAGATGIALLLAGRAPRDSADLAQRFRSAKRLDIPIIYATG